MDGIFECLVERKKPVYAPFISALVWAMLVISLAATLLLSPVFLLLAAGFGAAAYFLLPLFAVEWEYVFIDGSFEVDRILARSKRKKMAEYPFDRVDTVALLSHPDISRNLNNPGVEVVDYSSKTDESNVYGMLYSDQSKRLLLLIEPDEKMLKAMRRYSSRKVIM